MKAGPINSGDLGGEVVRKGKIPGFFVCLFFGVFEGRLTESAAGLYKRRQEKKKSNGGPRTFGLSTRKMTLNVISKIASAAGMRKATTFFHGMFGRRGRQ